jgi:lipopolysaccharide biosynthesis glycosyltransferase
MSSRPLHTTGSIDLVYAADERFFEGLLVAVASSLIWLDTSCDVRIHVLDGGISEKSKKLLRARVAQLRPDAEVHFRLVDQVYFSGFNPGIANSVMYYARFRMATLVPADLVVYVDTDTIVLEDLCGLLRHWKPEDRILAARDHKVRELQEDCPWPLEGEDLRLPYSNTGVLVTNLAWWRTAKVEEQALQLAKDAGEQCRWYDQTVFNFLFRRDIGELPGRWNFQNDSVNADVAIIHFTTGRKPWRYLGPSARFRAWRMVLRSCGKRPETAVLRHGGLQGIAFGLLEKAIRSSESGRRFLLPVLLTLDRKNAIGNQTYYGCGPGSRENSSQVDRNHPVLKKLRQKLALCRR